MNITVQVTHAFPDIIGMRRHAPYAWYVISQGHEEDKSVCRITRRTSGSAWHTGLTMAKQGCMTAEGQCMEERERGGYSVVIIKESSRVLEV